jgi:hypothetical protein
MSEVAAILASVLEDEDFEAKDAYVVDPPAFTWQPVGETSAIDVFVDERWIGRVTQTRPATRHQPATWVTNWMPNAEAGSPDPQPREFSDPKEAALWLWQHRQVYMESEDDFDTKEMLTNYGFPKGTRVRIVDGNYAGELGTVVGTGGIGGYPGEKGFYVHLDGVDDPLDAILYPGNRLELVIKEDKEARRRAVQDSTNAMKLVTDLTEGDDDDDDVDIDTKEFGHDPVALVVSGLQQAGFTVEQGERQGDEAFIKFTWPTFNAVAYVNGAKRALEIIRPLIPLRHSDYKVDRELTPQGKIARMFIRKRITDDPNLWKATRQPSTRDRNVANPGDEHLLPGFYTISFNGKDAGEIYCEQGRETAERVVDEMAQLHQAFPFYPQGWDSPGNAWGKGRAVEWWRQNRYRLRSAATKNNAFFDRSLLAAT